MLMRCYACLVRVNGDTSLIIKRLPHLKMIVLIFFCVAGSVGLGLEWIGLESKNRVDYTGGRACWPPNSMLQRVCEYSHVFCACASTAVHHQFRSLSLSHCLFTGPSSTHIVLDSSRYVAAHWPSTIYRMPTTRPPLPLAA